MRLESVAWKEKIEEISQKENHQGKDKGFKGFIRRPNIQIMGIPEGENRTDGRLLIIK